MNKQKQTYLSPETETLVVRFEGVVCLSGGESGDTGKAGGVFTPGGNFNNYGDL